MKNILLILITLSTIWSCSSGNDVPVEDIIEEPSENIPLRLTDSLREATKDTISLRIITACYAYTPNDTMIMGFGIKNQKIWCGFFTKQDDNKYKEQFVWVSKNNFSDKINLNIGYGEVKKISIIPSESSTCYIWNKNIFVLDNLYGRTETSYNNAGGIYFSMFIDGEDMYPHNYLIEKFWSNGYYIGYNGSHSIHDKIVFDSKGEEIYKFNDYESDYIPVSLYEYIHTNIGPGSDNYYINRVRLDNEGRRESLIWSVEIRKPGTVINGNKPKLSLKYKIEGDYITMTYYAVNFDGTTDVVEVKINLLNGEIIEE